MTVDIQWTVYATSIGVYGPISRNAKRFYFRGQSRNALEVPSGGLGRIDSLHKASRLLLKSSSSHDQNKGQHFSVQYDSLLPLENLVLRLGEPAFKDMYSISSLI